MRKQAPAVATQVLYALLLATALIYLIDARTNNMPPKWDAKFYVDMAENGIVDNPNLKAPYAYRIGMPFLSRSVSGLLSVPVETGFRIVAWSFALCLLMSIFLLARKFTEDYRHALMTMTVLSLSAMHVKLPVFFSTLVDVSGYALIVIAFWALLTKRLALCLLVSSCGLLFKEFLAIPWIILSLYLARKFWRGRSRQSLGFLLISIAVGVSVILLPRLFIPVVETHQWVDPINDLSTLQNLGSAWLDEPRIFNIMFSFASYWLPTLLLLTPARFDRLRAQLNNFHLYAISGHVALVLLLTVYGGTNLLTFTSYAVAAQTVVLVLLLRCQVSLPEKIFLVAAMIFYNKIFSPMPTETIAAYVDFYGGWSSLVTPTTLMRFLEIGVFVALAAGIRAAARGHRSDESCDSDRERK